MPTPDIVTDGLILHLHAARATGPGPGINSPPTTAWIDLSGSGLDSDLRQFAFTGVSGWSPNALVFDGVDDSVNVIDNGIGVFDSQVFTLEVWITPALVRNRIIFCYPYSGSIYTFALETNNLSASLGGCGVYFNLDGVSRWIRVAFPAGTDITKPIQIVATVTWSPKLLYVNGVVVGQYASGGNILTANNPVTLGVPSGTMMQGPMHIVRYYNRVLSQAEIAQNFAAGIDWPADANIGTVEALSYASPIQSSVSRIGSGARSIGAHADTMQASASRLGQGARSGDGYLLPVESAGARSGRSIRLPMSYAREIYGQAESAQLTRRLVYLQATASILTRKTRAEVLD